ncbi:ABC transporter substrate-binding protein [Microbacterium betulae]|uniref:ABC transporter substrate-binding protein n=1 Tax=Microbacterium betulae TaxID=2981139 RepID=A0AA97I834_9MICO|nr:ABC transporter substrate-binding protein [Microbacterium sp. AB]WOF24105.1 ABC transporter substrate-binding protein [Microbacterium sp. AB]
MPLIRRRLLAAAVLALALVTTGCTGASNNAEDNSTGNSGNSSDVFPVTIDHKFGETIITEKPETIVALSALSADNLISLGVLPDVTMPDTWAGDEDGYNPWTREAIEELGAEIPPTFPFNAAEIDYEEVLSYAPDLIFATEVIYDETVYERLSEIAPTIMAPAVDSGRDGWREQMLDTGAAVGELAAAEEIVATTEAVVADVRDAHPELEGHTFVMSRGLLDGDTSMLVYTSASRLTEYAAQLGLENASIADELAENESGYTGEVSLEELDTVDADLWIGFIYREESLDLTLDNALLGAWEPFATGNYFAITDRQLTQAMSFSTPLSIEWGASQLADAVAEVIENAEG